MVYHRILTIPLCYTVKVKVALTALSVKVQLFVTPWNSPGQNTEVGSLSLLQGFFLTQAYNPGLPHCRRMLHQLSHQGSPAIE